MPYRGGAKAYGAWTWVSNILGSRNIGYCHQGFTPQTGPKSRQSFGCQNVDMDEMGI